jgi:hypothetical protein
VPLLIKGDKAGVDRELHRLMEYEDALTSLAYIFLLKKLYPYDSTYTIQVNLDGSGDNDKIARKAQNDLRDAREQMYKEGKIAPREKDEASSVRDFIVSETRWLCGEEIAKELKSLLGKGKPEELYRAGSFLSVLHEEEYIDLEAYQQISGMISDASQGRAIRSREVADILEDGLKRFGVPEDDRKKVLEQVKNANGDINEMAGAGVILYQWEKDHGLVPEQTIPHGGVELHAKHDNSTPNEGFGAVLNAIEEKRPIPFPSVDKRPQEDRKELTSSQKQLVELYAKSETTESDEEKRKIESEIEKLKTPTVSDKLARKVRQDPDSAGPSPSSSHRHRRHRKSGGGLAATAAGQQPIRMTPTAAAGPQAQAAAAPANPKPTHGR